VYGVETLSAILPAGERTLLVYGGRYLVTALGERTIEGILDLDALRHPPNPDPKWAQFAEQDVTHAVLDGERLYVCNGGGSYASEVHGKKGYVTLLDRASGKVIWRSPALVCFREIALLGDYLVTAYGFTKEPNALYLLRTSDGTIAASAPLDSTPEQVEVDNGQILVRTEKVASTFVVKR
jgi:hypothetical protein